MLVGDILVKMAADMADLRTGFDQGQAAVKKFVGDMGSAIDTAKSALAALGVSLSAGLFAKAIKDSIDFADTLNDLSQKTGVSVETLGGLGYVAGNAGTSLEAVAGASGKLARNMVEAAGGNKEAAAAFKALGIDVETAGGGLKNVDQVMFELADRFVAMKDGPEKTALAMQYFGKSGADMIPILNQGSAALKEQIADYERYGGVSTETAQRADAFSDSLGKLQLMSGAFTKELAAALLPVLQAVANILVDAKSKGDGFSGAIAGIVTGFKLLVSGALYAVEIITDVGKGLGALAAAVAAIASGDFRGAVEVIKGYSSDVKTSWSKTADDVDRVWTASTGNMVTTSNTHGPGISAPIVKAAKDSKDEIKKLIDEFHRMEAADEAGLATNTVKQLGDLMKLLDSGKISRDDYDRWLGLILDKDPVLKAEQEKLNKALKDGEDAVNKIKDAWTKELTALDDRIQKQTDANTAFGLGKSALIDLQIAHLGEKIAMEQASDGYTPYVAHLEEMRGKLVQLRDAVAIGEGLERQKRDLEAAAKEWDKFIGDVSQSMSNFLQDMVTNGAGKAFKDLWDNFKRWALQALADIAARQIVVSITGALNTSGAAGAGLLSQLFGGTSTGGGGGGGIFDAVLGAGGKLVSGFGDLAFAAADFTQLVGQGVGIMDAFSMAASGAGLTLGSLVPVVGGVIAAGTLIYNWLSSKGGGPKEGGFATTGPTPGITGTDSGGIRWFTPSTQDAGMQQAVSAINAQYQTLLNLLGGTGSAVFAQGFSTDPQGTAPSNVHTGVFTAASQVFNAENANVGRDEEALKDELETQSMRALLAALQSSELPTVVHDYLASIDVSTATVAQITAALAQAADLKILADQVSALPADMANGLLAALGVSDELDAKIRAFAAEFAAFSAAADSLQDALDRDPQAEALQAVASAHASTFDKVGLAKTALAELLDKYDGSTTATEHLTAATNLYRDAQRDALLQVYAMRDALLGPEGLFSQTQHTLDWALMSKTQQTDWLIAEAKKQIDILKTTTDPEQIDKLAGLINRDLVDAFNLMEPAEQKKQHDYIKGILEDAKRITDTQLTASESLITDAGTAGGNLITNADTALQNAAQAWADRAVDMQNAANDLKQAAADLKQAAADAAAAASNQVSASTTMNTAANTMQTAASTPVQVEVTYGSNEGP